MTPTVHRCKQQSDEWHQLHIGLPTASNFHKILTPTGKKSEQRKGYMYRLIAERLLGEHLPARVTSEGGRTYWLDRGIDMEPVAIKAFEEERKVLFEPVGFITSPLGRFGCSPDGLVIGKNESIEIKSPAPWTQMEYLLAGLGSDYKPQVQGQLIVGNFDCVHFYAFHPRMPRKYIRTDPELSYIATLRQALDDFVGELDAETQRAKELGIYVRADEVLRA